MFKGNIERVNAYHCQRCVSYFKFTSSIYKSTFRDLEELCKKLYNIMARELQWKKLVKESY